MLIINDNNKLLTMSNTNGVADAAAKSSDRKSCKQGVQDYSQSNSDKDLFNLIIQNMDHDEIMGGNATSKSKTTTEIQDKPFVRILQWNWTNGYKKVIN